MLLIKRAKSSIDFKKAFDSVWHEGLFRKLENKGINGNFLQVIKYIYKKTIVQ